MTAIPRRRRTRSLIALSLAVILIATAGVLVGVAVGTLRNSQAGEAVGIDDRPVSYLPSTPNALLAVVGDDGELTSIVVTTLLPSGRGGTIVTMPVNADMNSGVGDEAMPLGVAFDQLEFDEFVGRVESMLTIGIERAERVDDERLAELVAPVVPIDVVLPEDVVNSSDLGTGIVAVDGEQELRGSLVVDVLTATDVDGSAYDHHAADLAVWSGLAANAPVPVSSEIARDEFGEPVPPASVDDLVQRLWEAPVQVRDLQIIAFDVPADGDDSTTGDTDASVDVVRVDHRDTVLVFAQISPALVSTPNPALSFRLELGFAEEQLIEGGAEFENVSDLARQLIGELLFLGANVVSIDLTETPGGAQTTTDIAVANEWFLVDMNEFASLLFGESNVEIATELIDGVDVVVVLGTDYLRREADRDEITESSAAGPDDTVDLDE
ncbi:MAG: hypothetical protein QNM02_09460 [Acidimicrobiia bacterium]|nr:hypothetical protein [Acidimicrobiia bacterium]